MKVIWTEEALDRLIEIRDFIAKDAPDRATDFIRKLVDKGDHLGAHPLIGRTVPEWGSSRYREVFEGPYRIIYRVRSFAVEILTVFEGHQRLSPKGRKRAGTHPRPL